MDGSLAAASAVSVTSGTLGGGGTVANVTVSGGTLQPGLAADEAARITDVHVDPDNILDAELYHAWAQAKNLKRIAIVNGLVRGQLTRALRGEDVGTVIVKEAA